MTAHPDSPAPPEATDPIGLLARAVDDGATGTLEWPSLAEAGPLVLRQGKLFLRKESALGLRGREAGEGRPGADTIAGVENPAEARLLAILATRLARPGGPATLRVEATVGERLVGPLRVRPLLMEGAVTGRSEAELLASLDGGTSWVAVVSSPAVEELAGYPDALRKLVSRLAEPATIDDVVRLSQAPRAATLANLARLRAVGLIRRTPRATPVPDDDTGRESRVDPRVLARFLDRIERSLREQPLTLESEEHRSRVAALVREGGGTTHYELLGVGATVSDQGIAAAFESLGRVVHPLHAEALGLPGGEGVLQALFERVTHAYRTLSDPDLRREYDSVVDSGAVVEDLSPEELERARARMAKASYRRARECLAREEYHEAVELMRDAVRWDGRADHWALLGEAQLQNPKWLQQAVESLEEALRLEPGELRYRVLLGKALEALGSTDDAAEEYRRILERSPDLREAREALERLEAGRSEEHGPGILSRILDWLGRGR